MYVVILMVLVAIQCVYVVILMVLVAIQCVCGNTDGISCYTVIIVYQPFLWVADSACID